MPQSRFIYYDLQTKVVQAIFTNPTKSDVFKTFPFVLDKDRSVKNVGDILTLDKSGKQIESVQIVPVVVPPPVLINIAQVDFIELLALQRNFRII